METAALSALPIAISLASLVFSILAFRSSGPRLHCSCFLVAFEERGPWRLVIEIANDGRAALSIDILGVEEVIHNYSGSISSKNTLALELEGPSLPFRMEGNSSERWTAPGDSIHGDVKPPWGDSAKVIISSGRRTMKLPVKSTPRNWVGRDFDIKGVATKSEPTRIERRQMIVTASLLQIAKCNRLEWR